jgi:hypothetical protein
VKEQPGAPAGLPGQRGGTGGASRPPGEILKPLAWACHRLNLFAAQPLPRDLVAGEFTRQGGRLADPDAWRAALRHELPAALVAAAPALLEAARRGRAVEGAGKDSAKACGAKGGGSGTADGAGTLVEALRRQVADEAGQWDALLGACLERMEEVRRRGLASLGVLNKAGGRLQHAPCRPCKPPHVIARHSLEATRPPTRPPPRTTASPRR